MPAPLAPFHPLGIAISRLAQALKAQRRAVISLQFYSKFGPLFGQPVGSKSPRTLSFWFAKIL